MIILLSKTDDGFFEFSGLDYTAYDLPFVKVIRGQLKSLT